LFDEVQTFATNRKEIAFKEYPDKLDKPKDILLSAFYEALKSLLKREKDGIFVGLVGCHSNLGHLLTSSNFQADPDLLSRQLPYFTAENVFKVLNHFFEVSIEEEKLLEILSELSGPARITQFFFSELLRSLKQNLQFSANQHLKFSKKNYFYIFFLFFFFFCFFFF
jgi:hypothetical protein